MRQTDGMIFKAIYYDVICTSYAIICMSYAHRPPVSTYEVDAVIHVFVQLVSLLADICKFVKSKNH